MKRIKFLALSIFILLFIACSKDDAISYPKEDFLAGYLSETGFDEDFTEYIDFPNSEFGIEFSPTVNGKITEIKVKLPAVRNDLRVTIWDKLIETPLRTETVNVSTVGETMIFNIDDIELTAGKEYAITMNSTDYYQRHRSDISDANYPITIGNIEILAFKSELGVAQDYPTSNSSSIYNGDLSFNFQRTE